jgi:hypothetical protein
MARVFDLYRQVVQEAANRRVCSQSLIQTSVELCTNAVMLRAEARALCARGIELRTAARPAGVDLARPTAAPRHAALTAAETL